MHNWSGWHDNFDGLGLEWLRGYTFCHWMGSVKGKQNGFLRIHVRYHHHRQSNVVIELFLEKTDIIHSRHPVRYDKLYPIHPAIIFLLRNRPPIPTFVSNRLAYVVPSIPHHSANNMAMVNNVNLWSDSPDNNNVNNKIDAKLESICCDGCHEWYFDDWYFQL